MKRLLLIVLAVAICIAPTMAAKKSGKVDSEDSYSSNGMAGKVGLGNRTFSSAQPDFIGVPPMNGAAVRVWINDDTSLDTGLGFASAKDVSGFAIGGNMLFTIKETKNIKLSIGPGIQYYKCDLGDIVISEFGLNGSFNAEFFFSELPELGFNAGLTGLGLGFGDVKPDNVDAFSSTAFKLGPSLNFGIRYYFN